MKLTPDILRQNAAAMIAWADGKPVQFRDIGEDFDWRDNTQPTWKFSEFKYRPKPEPRVRPWNCPADVPGPVCWLRRPATWVDGAEALVLAVRYDGIVYMAETGRYLTSWRSLGGVEYSTDRKTWRPCTVTEEA